MSELHCEIQKIQEPENPALTVGERFILNCAGETIPALDATTAELRLDPKDKYKLKLLRFEKTSDARLRLEVLSDQVGAHELKAVSLTDASQSVVIQDLRFEVRSVQDPQNPVQEPFGAMGPVGLQVPWFYWMGLVAAISLIGIGVAWRVLRIRERRKLMRQIEDAASAQDPQAEMFSKLRKFNKEFPWIQVPALGVPDGATDQAVQELNRIYRVYLSRRYQLPAVDWGTAKTIRHLKRERKEMSAEQLRRTGKILTELDRSHKVALKPRDLAQLTHWVREGGGL